MNLNLTVGEILNVLEGAQTTLEHTLFLENISSLDKAGSHDLAVIIDRGDQSVFDAVGIEKIKKSNAGVLLASSEPVPGKKYILVKDSVAALQRLVDFIERREPVGTEIKNKRALAYVSPLAQVADDVSIEAFAVIHEYAIIGSGSFIGPQVFIGKNCVIGKNVKLHPGVKILDRCVVGDSSIIHSGAVIGSDGFGYKVDKTGMQKIPHLGIVRIGKNVEIGANCSLDRAANDETIIGDGVKMDNGVHIAHNVIVGQSTAILAQTGIAGSAVIGAGCQIGGQVAIKDHAKIGNFVKIVSKSAVLEDLRDNSTVCGIPAIPFSQWKRIIVVFYHLPELWKLSGDLKAMVDKYKSKKSWIKRLFGLGR